MWLAANDARRHHAPNGVGTQAALRMPASLQHSRGGGGACELSLRRQCSRCGESEGGAGAVAVLAPGCSASQHERSLSKVQRPAAAAYVGRGEREPARGSRAQRGEAARCLRAYAASTAHDSTCDWHEPVRWNGTNAAPLTSGQSQRGARRRCRGCPHPLPGAVGMTATR